MRFLGSILAAGLAVALLAAPARADDEKPLRKRDRAAQMRREGAGRAGRHDQDEDRPFERGPGMRGPMAQGPMMRGPMARGPQARGPRARGPQARGPMMRGPMAQGRGGPQAAAAIFERIDRNHDGVLDKREFTAALAHLQAQRSQGRQAARGRGMQQGQRGAWRQRAMMNRQGPWAQRDDARGQARAGRGRDGAQARRAGKPQPPRDGDEAVRRQKVVGAAILKRLEAADTDRDGALSRAEAPEVVKRHFDALDKNDDGILEKGELKGLVKILAREGKKQQGPDVRSRDGRKAPRKGGNR